MPRKLGRELPDHEVRTVVEMGWGGTKNGALLRRAGGVMLPNGSPGVEAMDYRERITIEPDKRGGKPCIRGMRITVYDVLGYLASGMSEAEILEDFPYLEPEDIRASLAFAADLERKLMAVPSL